jgi:hypothetical protein
MERIKLFFKKDRKEAYRVSDSTTPETHERFIEEERKDRIYQLLELLPQMRYNQTSKQPENMLEATLYYIENMSRAGEPNEKKTITCTCGLIGYDKNQDIMTLIIKSERFVKSGYEIMLSPTIDNGSLILTYPRQFNPDYIPTLPIWTNPNDTHNQTHINIKKIIISEHTIDQALLTRQ